MREGQKRDFARHLRRRMTDAECRLWFHLRHRGLRGCKFRRQHPIGPYVVDFVCLDRRLILEVDGGQHDGCIGDARRDAFLRRGGFRVLHFWNTEVLQNIDGVLEGILEILSQACPQPGLPPQAGEGDTGAIA